MNPSEFPFCIYLEDAPVVASCPATGLSKALVPMLRELSPRTRRVFIVQTHRRHDNSCIERTGQGELVATGGFDFALGRIAARLPFRLGVLCARLHGAWLGLRMRAREPGGPGAVLWSAIGVDPLSLVRGASCARWMGAAFEPYLVDDIETHPANAAKDGLNLVLRRVLQASRHVYAITPELGSRCHVRYGVQVTPLPLTAETAEPTDTGKGSASYFAAYLGSINHLYEEGLRLLINEVGNLRERTGKPLRVRVIAPVGDVSRLLGRAVPDWVVCGVEVEQAALAEALAGSEFCYLPYSHAESARIMATSSFPSKLLDYLASARQIVVFAPQGSVPFNFFHREGLDFVTDSESDLRAHLAKLASTGAGRSGTYRAALMREHGPGRATAILFGEQGER